MRCFDILFTVYAQKRAAEHGLLSVAKAACFCQGYCERQAPRCFDREAPVVRVKPVIKTSAFIKGQTHRHKHTESIC